MFYELADSSWGNEEVAAMQKVIDSGFFSMGPKVKEFEQAFADYHGKKYGVMVNSGSSANLVAVASLFFKKDNPLKPGDEVIVPAVSWSTSYYPLQQYGLKLRFVDVELDSINMDVSVLESAITPKTRMIMGVSILGNPAKLDAIQEFAKAHDLYFMEDNCESLDAELNGQKAGTFGLVNTFSFFFSHHISTMEGGMILTDDEEVFHLMKAIRNHGWTRDLPADSPIYEKREDDFFEAYRFIVPGYNVRPGELNAVIGLEQLKKLPEMTSMRRANLSLFQSLFANDDRFIIQTELGNSSAFCFPIILNPEKNIDRQRVMKALKEADIGFRIITGGNFLRHDVIKYFDYSTYGDMSNADLVHDHGFFVGNHPKDLSEQLYRLKSVLDEATS